MGFNVGGLGFEEVTMTDHEFAKFLREKDPKWYSRALGNSNAYRDSKGVLLAVAIYDNAKCTRKIYLPTKQEVK